MGLVTTWWKVASPRSAASAALVHGHGREAGAEGPGHGRQGFEGVVVPGGAAVHDALEDAALVGPDVDGGLAGGDDPTDHLDGLTVVSSVPIVDHDPVRRHLVDGATGGRRGGSGHRRPLGTEVSPEVLTHPCQRHGRIVRRRPDSEAHRGRGGCPDPCRELGAFGGGEGTPGRPERPDRFRSGVTGCPSTMDLEEYSEHTYVYVGGVPPTLEGIMRSKAPGTIADFGCGDGTLLMGLRDAGLLRGWSAVGVEGSSTRVERLQARWPELTLDEHRRVRRLGARRRLGRCRHVDPGDRARAR